MDSQFFNVPVQRRNFDSAGHVKTPMTVLEAEEMGAMGVYAQCLRCGHRGEVPFYRLNPAGFIPDVGLTMTCSKCKGDEIETWTKWLSVHGSER